MNIIIWLVFGALVGWVASKIMNTDGQQGPLANIIVGIAGAFIGGYAHQSFGGSGVTGFNITSLVVALVGAIVLLAAHKMIAGRR